MVAPKQKITAERKSYLKQFGKIKTISKYETLLYIKLLSKYQLFY